MFKATVSAIESISDDIRILRLIPDAGYDYKAGQYAELTFDGFEARPFSIANAPGADFIEFHIRGVGHGARAYAAQGLKVGDEVMVSAPMGACVYIENCAKPIMAIAGGIGLAPIKAILEEAVRHKHGAPVYLYFGGRIESDLYLHDALEALAADYGDFTIVTALSEQDDGRHRSGLIADVVLEDFKDLSPFRVYIGGPPAMIEASVPGLLGAGLDVSCIHSDTTITMARPDNGDPARVHG
ncbi:MAG: oxidoreductase [Rhodospirillales bacterium]|nr:oxidoreductase [Rhodospirillales bacterium]